MIGKNYYKGKDLVTCIYLDLGKYPFSFQPRVNVSVIVINDWPFKKPSSIGQSGRKEIWKSILVIHWAHRRIRTRFPVLLPKHAGYNYNRWLAKMQSHLIKRRSTVIKYISHCLLLVSIIFQTYNSIKYCTKIDTDWGTWILTNYFSTFW